MTERSKLHFGTVDSSYSEYDPCVIPVTGYNYSMVKSIFVQIFNWDKLSHIFNCDKMYNISIFPTNSDKIPGIEMRASPNLVKIHDYTQATGIVGITGDPLPEPTCDFEDFDRETPFLIWPGIISGNAISSLARIQMRLSPDARQGDFKLLDTEITGWIDD